MPGVVYVVTTMIIVVGAVNGQNNLLFWLFGLAVGGLVVSGIISGASLMGIRLERAVPARARVGEPTEIRYRVRNRNRFFPAFALLIEEWPVAFRRNESPTWSQRMPLFAAFCPGVRAGSMTPASASIIPHARGEASFVAVRVSSTFPFGITRKSVMFIGHQRTLIWPEAIEANLSVVLSGATGDEDVASQRRSGGGEFVALREYVAGDPVRSIAWKPTSRLGRPIVREYAPPASRRLWLVCEVPPSTPPAHTERIISTVAGLADDAATRGILVGLADSGGHIQVPIGAGPRHDRRMLDALAVMQRSNPKQTAAEIGLDEQTLSVVPDGFTSRTGLSLPVFAPAEAAAIPARRINVAHLRERLVRVWSDWLSPKVGER